MPWFGLSIAFALKGELHKKPDLVKDDFDVGR
jgi:hypothetical protein